MAHWLFYYVGATLVEKTIHVICMAKLVFIFDYDHEDEIL